MRIGIDASRAFSGERTGIEEYSFQVINYLKEYLKNDQACLPMRQVVLYIRKSQKANFNLPSNWMIKEIKWPFLWTQIGLSLEMLFHPVDVLFIPAHVVPLIHPKKTIVTIHGLEYEFFPRGYSFWERLYMRWSIKASCWWAKKIIAVSQNTKKDLAKLYQVPEEKIEVVYEGANDNFKFQILNLKSISNEKIFRPYVLFIGRLEERKNVVGIIKAFEILKEKYKIPHQLILAGKPGYGYANIKCQISNAKYQSDIFETGFVSEEKKCNLLKKAEVFLFPSFYEGFGLPILEAQISGVPVITSNISSMPEVAGGGALIINPRSPEKIAEAAWRTISDKALKDDIIKKGHLNVDRFSWSRCAHEIAQIIMK